MKLTDATQKKTDIPFYPENSLLNLSRPQLHIRNDPQYTKSDDTGMQV